MNILPEVWAPPAVTCLYNCSSRFHHSSFQTQLPCHCCGAAFSLPSRHGCSVPGRSAALTLKAAYLGLPFAGCETFGGSHNLSALPLFKTCEKSTKTKWQVDLKCLTQCVPCNHQIIDIFPNRGPMKLNHLGNHSRLSGSTGARIFVCFRPPFSPTVTGQVPGTQPF